MASGRPPRSGRSSFQPRPWPRRLQVGVPPTAGGTPPTQLASTIRSHWEIENGLYWVLDVGFNEDASRVREPTAARNLGLLRKIALNFARANTTLKASLKGKRKSAAWNNDFMATLIAG